LIPGRLPFLRDRQENAAEHNPALNQINLRHVLDIIKKWDDSRIKVDRKGRRIDTGNQNNKTYRKL
jgi:hypothetical protein